MVKDRVKPGGLLIAPPKMTDARFKRSVIFLAHNTGTAMGFCLNRQTPHSVSDVEPNVHFKEDIPLYWGGPVNVNTVWMLHSPDWQLEVSIPVTKNWMLTSHLDMFQQLGAGAGPEKYRVFFGCSNWGPGQLEGELGGNPPWSKSHSWLTLNNPDPEWVLECDPDDLWTHGTELCSRQAVHQWMD
jgi:putative transcriptional regulator